MKKIKNRPDIAQRFIAGWFRAALSLRYKVIISGKELLWSDKPKLFLPNHQSLIDPVIIVTKILQYQKVSSAVSATYFENPLFRAILNWIEAIPVTDLERGNRDIDVLKKMVEGTVNASSAGKNALIYPSGQLASQPEERIRNKQGVYRIIPLLPDTVMVVGIRVRGLWGSTWSRAATGRTPDFMRVFWRGVWFLIKHGIFFAPRRKVFLELVDITKETKQKAATSDRRTFNRFLEDFFNVGLK